MRISAPVRAAAQRLTLPFLVFVSAMLVVFGKTDTLLYDNFRIALADRLEPVLEIASQPVTVATNALQAVSDAANMYRENARLREENARLLQWQQVARHLAIENAELRGLVKLVPQDAIHTIAARVIADSGGAFARSVLIDAGRRDGVARGQAALNGEGLVGRVAEVGERTARILLLTDLNSHVPVEVVNTHERAMLDGDNSEQPRLVYLPSKTEVKVGERIVTDGAGGVFPPGLPVGVVASVSNGVIRVAPDAELSRIELVRVVDFGLSGVLPQSAVPSPRRGRAAKSGAVSR